MTTKPLTALVAGGALVVVSLVSTATLQLSGASAPPPRDPSLGGGSTTPGNKGNGNAGASNPGHPIGLSGTVVGHVAPGSPATLTVTINNPNNQDIIVTSLTGTITSVTTLGLPGRPACSPSWYSAGTFTGSKPIAKNTSGTVSVPLMLADLAATNQDNCKGSTVQFSFTAQARQE